MSRSIDQRAVIMEFDNEQFEKGIAQSKKSLAEFEEKLQLKGASDAINKINKQFKNIDFSLIQNSLESIADRFSNFGIVGMTVVQNLTNAVVDFTKGALTNLYNKINTAGKNRALNIEKAHFLLQGILKDEDSVQDAMDRADRSVTGTAYAYDSAAKAAATFVTVGQRGEELEKSLNAVADLTAMVSGNYDDISNIIQKIVGSHKLYKDEMNQITQRGFTLDEYIAKYIEDVNNGLDNVPEKVRQNIKELDLMGQKVVTASDLSKNGKLKTIYSETVIEAIEHSIGGMAHRANETFSGAIENIGAAWARIGALFWTPLVAQNSELVKFINALRVNINAVKEGLRPFAESVTNIILKLAEGAKIIGVFEKSTEGVESASGSALKLKELTEALFKVVKPLFDLFEAWIPIQNEIFGGPLIDRINRIITQFTSFVDHCTDAWEITVKLRSKIDVLAQTFNKALKPVRDFWDMVSYAFYTVFDVGDKTGGIEKFVDKLTELFRKINKAYDRWEYRNSIADSFIKIFESIKIVGESVWKVVQAIAEAFADVFIINYASSTQTFFEWFADILKKIAGFIAIDDEKFNSLKETFKNIFTVAKTLFDILGKLIDILAECLPDLLPFVTSILEATSGIIGFIAENINAEEAGNAFKEVLEFLKEKIELVVEKVQEAVSWFQEWIDPIKDAIEQSGILTSVNDLLATAFENLKTELEGAPEKIKEFCDAIGINQPSFEDFVQWLNDMKTAIDNLKESLQNFKISDSFDNFIGFIQGIFSTKVDEAGNGAASLSSAGGYGQIMKSSAKFVGVTKDAIDSAGGNSAFESVKDSILKFVIPLLNAVPKLAIAIMGLAALKTSLGILESIRKFKQPLADVREAWANVGKSFSKFIDKSAITLFIATLGFLVLSIAALLVVINKITDSNHPVATFVTFGVILLAVAGFIVGVSLAMNKILKSLNAQKNNGLDKVPKVMASIALVLVATAAVMLAVGKAMILMATAMQIAGGPGQFAIIAGFLAAYLIILMLIIGLLTGDAADKAKQGKGGSKKNPNLTASNADKQAQKYYGIAAIIGAVAVAMLAIGKAMVLMATAMKIDESVWWKSLIFFAAFGGFVIGLMFLAKQTNGVDYKALLSIAAVVGAVAVVMLAFAASIDIIMIAFAKMAALVAMGVDIKTTIGALAGVAAIIVVGIGLLAGLMVAMQYASKESFDYKSILAIAVAMLAFSAAIDLLMLSFTPLVALLSSPAASAAWDALKMLALMMGVMVAAIGVLTVVAAWAPGGGAAMIIAAAAMITFATAMLILSMAFGNFVAASAEFLLLLDAYSKISVDDIIQGVQNLFAGLSEGFAKALPSIQNFIGQLFTGDVFGMIFDYILQAIETKIGKIADSFGRIIDKIHEVLLEKKGKILEIKDTLAEILFGKEDDDYIAGSGKYFNGKWSSIDGATKKSTGLLGLLGDTVKHIFTEILPQAIVGFFEKLGELIHENADKIKAFIIGAVHWFGDIFREVVLVLIDVFNSMTDLIVEPLFYLLGSIIAHISTWLVDHYEDIMTILGAPITWFADLLMRHHQEIVDIMIAPFAWITDAVVQGHDTIMSGLGAITGIALEWLGILFQELRKWWDQHWEPDVEPFLYNSFMDTLSLAAKALVDSTVTITAAAVACGLSVIAGILQGLADGLPNIATQAITLVETIRDTVVTEENVDKMIKAGEGIVINFLDGCSKFLSDEKNITDLKAAIDKVGASLISAIKTFFGITDDGQATTGGRIFGLVNNILAGAANAIFGGYNPGGPLHSAITWLMQQVMGTAESREEGVDVGSPSKWSEWLGDMIVEGLAIGISKNSDKAVKSMEELGEDTKSAFAIMIESLKMAGDEEFDIDPVITPIVDTSNIESAAMFANSAFGSVGGGFAMSYGRAAGIASTFAQNGSVNPLTGNTSSASTVNFTQNNYSPKSLSHYEIYRQTKNLLRTVGSKK